MKKRVFSLFFLFHTATIAHNVIYSLEGSVRNVSCITKVEPIGREMFNLQNGKT